MNSSLTFVCSLIQSYTNPTPLGWGSRGKLHYKWALALIFERLNVNRHG
jgi:hypothetical protein